MVNMMRHKFTITRLLIAVVTFFNLQAALALLIWAPGYADMIGVAGSGGTLLVHALGVLFVMWNIPYLFALADPVRNRVSLIEALLMQTIGLAGEILLLSLGSPYLPAVSAIVVRYIVFDAAGLALLTGAYFLTA